MINFTCPQRYSGPDNDDFWREDSTCSYCGSLSNDLFMSLLDERHELIPTDKSYKVYVTAGKYSHHKFYFEHLTEAQQNKLVALLNSKVLKFAAPGHFYTLPYFIGKN